MRKLDRYIFREILVPGSIALVALTFVVLSQHAGLLLEIIFRQSPSASEIWGLVAAILPEVLKITIPMAVLVGILTGFSRMSSDSEAIALRASGISMWRIFRPVAVLAVVAFVGTTALTVWVAPETSANMRKLRNELAKRRPTIELRPRIFYERANWNWVLYVNNVFPGQNSLQVKGIVLVDTKDPGRPEITFAESGSLVPYESERLLQLTFSNSSKHVVTPALSDKYEIYSAPTNTVSVPLPAPGTPSTDIPVTELKTAELWERIRYGSGSLQERVEFHGRFSLPFACIAFALIGLPLGVSTHRGGRSMGLVLSLILMFAYYLAVAGGTQTTSAGSFPPLLGVWLPNIVFSLLGIVLLARSDREHENRVLAGLSRGISRLLSVFTTFRIQGVSASRRIYSFTLRLRFFRLLDIYVLRGFFFFFGIVLGMFSAVFIVVTLFELLPDIIKHKIGIGTVATYFLFLLPQILYWIIPLAVLFAVLIQLGTLTKANEILAVKAGAVSLYRMSFPLILMGVLMSGTVYAMQDYLLPWTNRKQDEYHDIIKNRAPQTYRDPHRKWMMGSDNRLYNYVYYDPERNAFANISILTIDPKTFQLREWLYAKQALWNGRSWTLDNGWVRTISESHTVSAEEPFSRKLVNEMDEPGYFKKEVREADQMNYSELRTYVADLQRSGLDVTALTVDLYRKLSFPLVSFIMALIGVPFSFKTGRKGAFYGIGFCVAIGILYWSTFELFGKLGGISQLSPVIAAWFPNLIFGAGGFWMMLRVKT